MHACLHTTYDIMLSVKCHKNGITKDRFLQEGFVKVGEDYLGH